MQETTIKIFYRLGQYKPSVTAPRKILVSLTSCWDVRKLLAAAPMLKTHPQKIFISADLSPENREIEKKLLKKRWEMITAGADRSDMKIKKLTLFCKEKEVLIE